MMRNLLNMDIGSQCSTVDTYMDTVAQWICIVGERRKRHVRGRQEVVGKKCCAYEYLWYSREALARNTYADELGSVRRGRVAGSTGGCTHHLHHPCIRPVAPCSHAATRLAQGDIFARVRDLFTSTAAAAMRALIVARACTLFTQKVRPL
jgi:hypothetical protein